MRTRNALGAAAAVAVVVSGTPAPAAGGGDPAELSLLLDDAVSWIEKAGQARVMDLALDVDVRGGTLAENVLGTTVLWDARFAVRAAHNKAELEGRVAGQEASPGRWRIRVEGRIPRDKWGTGGAEAAYDLDLRREGGALQGTFAGAFGGRPVKGKASGRLAGPFSTPIAGFAPPAPREHPRLVFRREERAHGRRLGPRRRS